MFHKKKLSKLNHPLKKDIVTHPQKRSVFMVSLPVKTAVVLLKLS